MVDFAKLNKDDQRIIQRIALRVVRFDSTLCGRDVQMSLAAAHLHTPLNFQKLYSFDRGNLMHDVLGILRHVDHDTGELTDCFLPRCSR